MHGIDWQFHLNVMRDEHKGQYLQSELKVTFRYKVYGNSLFLYLIVARDLKQSIFHILDTTYIV